MTVEEGALQLVRKWKRKLIKTAQEKDTKALLDARNETVFGKVD